MRKDVEIYILDIMDNLNEYAINVMIPDLIMELSLSESYFIIIYDYESLKDKIDMDLYNNLATLDNLINTLEFFGLNKYTVLEKYSMEAIIQATFVIMENFKDR